MVAVQFKENGQLVDKYPTMREAKPILEWSDLEAIEDIEKVSHIKVVYTELGGPWGYGHQEPAFETYGGIVRCVINLYKWVLKTAKVFGPDVRDIKDYFRNCTLHINGKNYTNWFQQNVKDRITKQMVF